MENKECIIVGAGTFYEHNIKSKKNCLMIAADGGYSYMKDCGIEPDVVIGDFDSLGDKPIHHNIIALKKEKDDTDMLSAIKYGLRLGIKSLHIYGGTGGRIDHTLANIQSLAFLSTQNAQGFLYDEKNIITAITNSIMTFDERYTGVISVFAHSCVAKGVTEEGLLYRLEDATLYNTNPLGVSNEFIGSRSYVTVKDGTILLVYPILCRE